MTDRQQLGPPESYEIQFNSFVQFEIPHNDDFEQELENLIFYLNSNSSIHHNSYLGQIEFDKNPNPGMVRIRLWNYDDYCVSTFIKSELLLVLLENLKCTYSDQK
jgi:hypothetical protein